jgi:hypothetical protein
LEKASSKKRANFLLAAALFRGLSVLSGFWNKPFSYSNVNAQTALTSYDVILGIKETDRKSIGTTLC